MFKKSGFSNAITNKQFIALFLSAVLILTSFSSLRFTARAADAGTALNWPSSTLSLGYMCCGVIIDAQGNTYSTDWSNGSIKKYTKDGVLDPTWPLQNTYIASNPIDLCFDKDGNIITGGQYGNYDEYGEGSFSPVKKINTQTYQVTDMTPGMYAIGFGTDAEGNFYVNEGGLLHKYSSTFVEIWRLQTICNIGACVDNQGNIYMTSEMGRQVCKVLPSGVLDTTFGPNGTGYLTLTSTISGTQLNSYIGLPTYYDDTLYVSCYGNNTVVKVTGNGRNVENVVTGTGPFSFIKYNDLYVMPSWSNSNISYIGAPTIDIQNGNFNFSMNPAKVAAGSTTPVNFIVNSTSTKNYTVKAQLINKATGSIVPDVTSTSAQLVDGDATLTLTPPSSGWVKGNYEIQLVISSTVNSLTLTNTLNVGVAFGVGYYSVNYNDPLHGTITDKTENVEIGSNGTASFTLTPDTGYFIDKENTTVSNGTLSLNGNTYTISNITGDVNVNVAFTNVSVPKPTDITGIPDAWTNQNQNISFKLSGDYSSVEVNGSVSGAVGLTNNNGIYSFTAQQNDTYTITVKNNGDQSLTYVKVEKIDKSNPSIGDFSGDTSNWTNSDTTISFTANDTLSGIASVSVAGSNTGSIAVANNNGTYSFDATDNEQYTVTVKDNAGNESVSTFEAAFIDKTLPEISIPSVDPSKATNTDVTVSFTASDNSSGIDTVVVAGDKSGNVNVAKNADTYSFTASQNDYFVITVTDKAGNQSFQDFFVNNIDKVAPTNLHAYYYKNTLKSFLNTLTFGLFFRESVTVILTADDYYSGVKDFTVNMTGKQPIIVSNNNGNYTFAIEPQFVGNFAVAATDNAGNTSDSIAVECFAVDSAASNAPTVNTNGYTLGSWTSNNVTITVSGSTADSGIDRYQYSTDNGETWTDMTTTEYADATSTTPYNALKATLTIIDGQQKSYLFRAVSNSCVNGTASSAVQVKIDKTSPDVIIPSGAPTQWTNKDAAISFSASDSSSGISSVTVTGSISGSKAVTNDKGTYSINATENEQYAITVTDNVGNQSVSYLNVEKIDKSNPEIGSFSGVPTSWTNSDQTISFKANDSISGIASVAVTDSDSFSIAVENINGTYSFNATENQQYTVTVKDNAGNESVSTVGAPFIDETLPEINTPSIVPSEWTNTDATVSFSATDNSSGIDTVEVVGDKSGNLNVAKNGETYSFTASQNDDFIILATDKAGNQTLENFFVENIDKTAPTNVNAYYYKNEFKSFLNTLTFGLFFPDTLTVVLSADDDLSGVKNFTVNMTGKQPITVPVINGRCSFAIEPQFIGNFTVAATDNAGNTSESKAVECFAVDSAASNAPTVNTNGYTQGSWTSKDVTVTVSGSTAVSGIRTYQYSTDNGDTWTDMTTTEYADATATTPYNALKATLTITDGQQKSYLFRALSNSLVEGKASGAVEVKIDKTTPVVCVNANQYDGSWTKGDVKFDLSNSAQNAAPVTYQYSTDSGEHWIDLVGTSLTINSDTNAKYIFRAVSETGVISIASSEYDVKVQKTVKEVTDTTVDVPSASGANSWYISYPQLKLTKPDVGNAAPISLYYQLYTGTTPSGTIEFTGNNQPTITSDGEYTLNVWTVDNAGNKSAVYSKVIKVDTTAPSADIKVSENSIKSLLNTITFGLFFKDKVDVKISTESDFSGIASIEYQKVASESEFKSDGTWTSGTNLSVTANEKFILYVRVTDNAGNVSVINSNGAVIYTDSAIPTTSALFCKESGKTGNTDIDVKLTLNGNTLNSVSLGSNVLTQNTDYTINGDVVTLKKEFLQNLTVFPAEFKFAFNPLGVAYSDGAVNQTPATQTFTVNELIHATVPEITTQPVGAVYSKGDTAQNLSVTATNTDNGTVSYQWYMNDKLIENATESTYAPSAAATGIYNYYAVVTNTNNSVNGENVQTVTSQTAKIVINNATVNVPVVSNDAPTVSVASESKDVLNSALTEADKEKLENGYDISVVVKVDSMKQVTEQDKELVNAKLEDNKLGLYIDLSLIKNLIDPEGNQTQEKITNLSKKIRITIDIPENLRNESRSYSIVRVHEGVAEVLPDLDSNPNTITIETDRFSTYALVYEDQNTLANSDNAKTGDSSNVVFYFLLEIMALALCYITIKNKATKITSK